MEPYQGETGMEKWGVGSGKWKAKRKSKPVEMTDELMGKCGDPELQLLFKQNDSRIRGSLANP